jgi:hypothetical protein
VSERPSKELAATQKFSDVIAITLAPAGIIPLGGSNKNPHEDKIVLFKESVFNAVNAFEHQPEKELFGQLTEIFDVFSGVAPTVNVNISLKPSESQKPVPVPMVHELTKILVI